jgi:hypothetical protein
MIVMPTVWPVGVPASLAMMPTMNKIGSERTAVIAAASLSSLSMVHLIAGRKRLFVRPCFIVAFL